ncbi:MAG: SsrA-binding protein SmpB [Spirochaetaceae bacterium]
MSTAEGSTVVLAKNKRAYFNFEVIDSIECGIELVGTEVKSIRGRRFSFADSYARVKDGEIWLEGLHISEYSHGNIHNHDPVRPRRLLAHKQEIRRLKRYTDEKGYTVVPLKFYLKGGLVKVEIGLCRGKRKHDKREAIKKRDQKREEERELKERF